MIARTKFEYLYGRLMAELGVDPDDPRRIEQCARWYYRFKDSSDAACEIAFSKLPEMMDQKQRTPSLPQMFDAMKIARGKLLQARTGEHAGEWCGLCEGRGTILLVKLPTGWWPQEVVMQPISTAFACPCGHGLVHRRLMAVYHDGLLAKYAPRPVRRPQPAPVVEGEVGPGGRPIAPAILAAMGRCKRGEGPREVMLHEEFERHGIPWVD